MTPLLLAALASLPCVYWTQGVDSRATLEAAGIKRICVAPEQVDAWRAAGFSVSAVSEADLEVARAARGSRHRTARRRGLADAQPRGSSRTAGASSGSPTGSTSTKCRPARRALAAAEAFAYGGDAVLKVDAADLKAVGGMLTFLESLPAADLPAIADLAVVDDGSAVTGEVMNLLSRRNLLYQIVKAPSSQFPITIAIGIA